MREHFVPPVLEEGYRQEPCQGYILCSVRSAATVDRLCGVGRVTIDMLPDNVLLEIFDFYKDDAFGSPASSFTWRWNPLTQVCRRWLHVVFGSPRRLGWRLVCTRTTPVSRLLDIWPPFPITVYLPY